MYKYDEPGMMKAIHVYTKMYSTYVRIIYMYSQTSLWKPPKGTPKMTLKTVTRSIVCIKVEIILFMN